MDTLRLVHTLGRNDVRLIGRDRFLLSMLGFSVYIAAALRYGLPWADAYLADHGVMPGARFATSLSAHFPMLVAFMVLFTGALLVGTVFGFILLDEKDDHTLEAMRVTPVPMQKYVLYRIGSPIVPAFLIIAGMTILIDQAMLPLWQVVLVSAGAALTAPIVSLFYALLADNKVQGFAMSKFGGIAGWIVMLGWFVPEPFQWLFGLFPPFWVSKAYWMALEGDPWWWAALAAGVTLQLVLLAAMMRRFDAVTARG